MSVERTRVDAKRQGNAGECREYRGMQGIQGNARGTYGSGCKVSGECWECRGMPRERMRVGVNCQGNAGNVWEWVYSARGMQGTTRGMQGSGCKVLAE